MRTDYQVDQTLQGWSVSEDGVVVRAGISRAEAIAVAHLMAVAGKAAGGSASLAVRALHEPSKPVSIDLLEGAPAPA